MDKLIHENGATAAAALCKSCAVKADLLVAAERRRVEQRAVVEELRDEFRSAHAGVAVGVGEHGGQSRHHQHLHDGVVTQSGRLAFRKIRKTTAFKIHGKQTNALCRGTQSDWLLFSILLHYSRNLHQAMLALINSAPHRPPNIPSSTNGPSSIRCQGAWNST